MGTPRTRLGLLLQARREAAGYSRTRLGELVDVPAGTIEGWEIGRVAKPPIHDVLKVARVLRVPVVEIEAAVLEPEQARDRNRAQPGGCWFGSGAAARAGDRAVWLDGGAGGRRAPDERWAGEGLAPRDAGMTLPEVMTVAALLALRAVGGTGRRHGSGRDRRPAGEGGGRVGFDRSRLDG